MDCPHLFQGRGFLWCEARKRCVTAHRLSPSSVCTRRSMKEPSAMGKPSSFPPTTARQPDACSPRTGPTELRAHRLCARTRLPTDRRATWRDAPARTATIAAHARKPHDERSVGHRVHRTARRVQRSNDQVAKAHPRRVPRALRTSSGRPVATGRVPVPGTRARPGEASTQPPEHPRTPRTKHLRVLSGHGQVPGTGTRPRSPTRGSTGRGR